MSTEILNAALTYIEAGFSVIPVNPKNKRPLLETWAEFQRRRPGKAEVISWWGLHPKAMIGIVTGKISGISVIDCDSQEAWERVQGMLPDSLVTPIAKTPRGYHLYFAHEEGLTTKAEILPGVDSRSDGGYIIAPPSIRQDGGTYTWVEGLDIKEVARARLPGDLLGSHAFNKDNNKGTYIEGDDKSETNAPRFFTRGRRDDDLFHAANSLTRGGADPAFTSQVLNILAQNCKPPFPQNEVNAKIASALSRAERREVNLAEDVREWVLSSTGVFLSSEVARCRQLSSRDDQKNLSKILSRLCSEGIIERYGNKNGQFRRIENDVEPVNFLDAPTEEFPITWPMGLEDHCVIYPGNIVVVAGTKSAGKTAFLLNVAKENMHRHEIVYLNSEMGDTEFRKRLELFDDVPLRSWRLQAFHRSGSFADLITPEKKIFIVDFLEVTTDFWKVAAYLQDIHKKLKDGIALVALQKSMGKGAGRGGDFSMEKARLYLTLDYLKGQNRNRLTIADAKAWRTDRNPRGMTLDYKLARGSRFVEQGFWRDAA